MMVTRGFVLSGMKLAVPGIVVGILGVFALSRYITSLLFEVSAGSPALLTLGAALTVVVSLLASAIPAVRAGRLDPMRSLRVDE